jgi:hypothetical protein
MKTNEEIAREGAVKIAATHEATIRVTKGHATLNEDGVFAIILQCLTQAQDGREGDAPLANEMDGLHERTDYRDMVIAALTGQLAASIAERDVLKAQFTPNGSLARENESLRAEVERLSVINKVHKDVGVSLAADCDDHAARPIPSPGAEGDTDKALDEVMRERDHAEEALDELASAILGEPIDWPDHAAKWAEALEAVRNQSGGAS